MVALEPAVICVTAGGREAGDKLEHGGFSHDNIWM